MKAKATLAIVVLGLAAVGQAGQWLAADAPAGGQPRFKPVPLFWFRVVRTPVVYRKGVTVPAGVDRATALLRSSGYVYVCVDGRQVYACGAAKDSPERARVPGEAGRVHELDLTQQLTPGRHVLTVSAPAGGEAQGGFVLDGGLYRGARRVAPLVSDASWTATAFRPTAILEDHAIMTPAYTGRAEKGTCTAAAKARAVGEAWTADEDALAAAHFKAAVRRVERDVADATWRLELLAARGLYIVDGAAYGWGGANRPTIARPVAEAARLLAEARSAATAATRLAGRTVRGAKELADVSAELHALARRSDALSRSAERLSRAAMRQDEVRAVELASRVVATKSPGKTTPAELRKAIAARLGHPLSRLNESRYDRLGWLPHPHLADSDLGRWGVRVNPVAGPTKLRLRHRWRFRTDPGDTGLRELRHTIGYNIENQWPVIDGQQSWTRDKRFRGYRGIAWYRGHVSIPAEWAGQNVLLRLRVEGKARVWFNDRELAPSAAGKPLAVPARAALFGADNLVAVRVTAEGPSRGLLGPTEVSCPKLSGPAGRQTPPVRVLATPLSPCVVLTPQTDTLRIHHAGRASVILPGRSAQAGYAIDADGRLKANWAMLWLHPAGRAGLERPILLVFQVHPTAITCERGATTVKLPKAGARVIAVRPWAKGEIRDKRPDVQAAAERWSRMALAVPVNYVSLTRMVRKPLPWKDASVDDVPAGPVLAHTVVYDYLVTEDDWKTTPLRIAPLPAPCSLAMDTKFRSLEIEKRDRLVRLQDGGVAGPYRALVGTDRVSYRYEVEPWPRLVGFTSWMFSWADTGVPGNEREMEIIAATGANSYRPQHNYADHRAGAYDKQGRWVGHYPPTEKRTRVQIMADFCRANGVNYMNNIDQTLGPHHKMVREDYDRWVRTVLYPHFDKLVPQLAGRPFWQVAYDLINEPFDHKAARYNAVTKELTRRIRKTDRRHLLYIEPCQAWGAIQQLRLIQPTGDPLTMYSFHDYNFRMRKAADRWPTPQQDITTICQMWWPAFEFAIRHGVGMHCGEYGGFAHATDDSLCQATLLNDFLRIFDQFGMHHHYYSGREIYRRQLDGSLRPSNVVRTFRRYARREDLNLYYELWPEHPKPRGR